MQTYKSCCVGRNGKRKTLHKTAAIAKARANKYAEEERAQFQVYPCRNGPGWHVCHKHPREWQAFLYEVGERVAAAQSKENSRKQARRFRSIRNRCRPQAVLHELRRLTPPNHP